MSSDSNIPDKFRHPIPIFPLNAAVLMPHGLLHLNIFEDRYRQMIADALEGSKLIAMAVFEGDHWTHEYHGRPPIRPAVCVGQIVQHMKMPDGRFLILLKGICRARIAAELPAQESHLYREAMLEPVSESHGDESSLEPFRHQLADALDHAPLSDLRGAKGFVEHLRDTNIKTSEILELVALSFVPDTEVRYQLLEAGDARQRARIIGGELVDLETLLKKAAPQRQVEAPKGCNWN